MDGVEIARCKNENWPEVFALLVQLWPGRTLEKSKLAAIYLRRLAALEYAFLGAIQNTRLVGFGSLSVKEMLWIASPVGNIDELVVDATHRGRGLGGLLLNRLIEEAKLRQCKIVELDSAYHREAAHRFYEQRGFERRAHLFFKPL